MATFVKKEAIDFGWKTVKNNLKKFIVFALVVILVSIIPQIIVSALEEQSKTDPNSISGLLIFIITVASYIINLVISIGIIRFSLKFVDGKKGEIKDLYTTNKTEVWHYFLGSLLYGLRVLLGYILLIVPGIIWSIKYSQYSYLIIDKGMKPSEAIKKSGEITNGNKMNLFLLGLLLGLINIAGVIALFFGLLVTIPLTLLAQAYVYRKLMSGAATATTKSAEISTPKESPAPIA